MLDKISYLAGLVDGEGHVSFSGCGQGKTRFVIEIKMTSEEVIDWLIENFGGYKVFRPSKKPRCKDQWRWRVQNNEAKELYTKLKSLLLIKNHINI